MKNFENIVVIYPKDKTTDFLNPIFEFLVSLLPNCSAYRPDYNSTFHTYVTENTQLIIFIGHGTSSGLFGGTNEFGEKNQICNVEWGANFFNECSVVLFSCNSADYLKNIKKYPISLNNYIVFGDMPTDKEHVEHNQNQHRGYWKTCKEETLLFYMNSLVDAISIGFYKSIQSNSFIGFYKGVCRSINKQINVVIDSSTWTKEIKLDLIERLVKVKLEIEYFEMN